MGMGMEAKETAAAPASAAATEYQGLTDYSNWVVPGRLMCGAYPRTQDIAKFLAAGFDTFVCLMPNDELRRERIDYFNQLKQTRPDVLVLHFPIKDGETAVNDKQFGAFLQAVFERYQSSPSSRIYVHCRRGHGRAGMAAAALYGMITGCTSAQALKAIHDFHATRRFEAQQTTPETHSQRMQVFRVLGR